MAASGSLRLIKLGSTKVAEAGRQQPMTSELPTAPRASLVSRRAYDVVSKTAITLLSISWASHGEPPFAFNHVEDRTMQGI
jgi:ribosome biogenesis protein Tsr3